MNVLKKVLFCVFVAIIVFIGVGYGVTHFAQKDSVTTNNISDISLKDKKEISQRIVDLLKKASVKEEDGILTYSFDCLTKKGLLNENHFIVGKDGKIKGLTSIVTFRNILDGTGWDTIYFSSSKGSWNIDVSKYEINGKPCKNVFRSGPLVTESFFISTNAICYKAFPILLGDYPEISFSKNKQVIARYDVTNDMKIAIINTMRVNQELEKLRKYDGSNVRLY